MNTEREAWEALIQLANQAGRRGHWVRNGIIIPPQTATQNYCIALEEYQPRTAGEMVP